MFDSISREGSLNPATGFTSLFASIVLHAFVVGLLLVVPLIFIKGLPQEPFVYLLSPPPMPVIKIPSLSPPSTDRPAGRFSAGSSVFQTSIPPEGMRPLSKIPRGIPVPRDEMPLLIGIPGGDGDSLLSGDTAVDAGIAWPSGISKPPPLPEPPQKPAPVQIGTLEPSKLIRKVDPVYPELARRARISGTVRLEAVIDEEGNVLDVTVLSGHQALRDAAADAVKQWKYTPTVQNGEPVSILAVISVVFKLH